MQEDLILCGNLARNRGVHIRGSFHGLDGAKGFTVIRRKKNIIYLTKTRRTDSDLRLGEFGSNIRKLNEHNIAKGCRRVAGDAHGSDSAINLSHT